MATLQFDLGDPDGAEMFRKASTGILQNLSFGTFIYKREKPTCRPRACRRASRRT
jgi:hypothetical protein